MNFQLDDEESHSYQTKINLSNTAKAKLGVYPRWQEKRMKDNQRESAQSLLAADRLQPLLKVQSYSTRFYYQQQGTILNNKQDSVVPLKNHFNSNINKLGDDSTYLNIFSNRQPTPLFQPSTSKHSTVITGKVKSEHHHHHQTLITPYRRLPLSYRQSAKKITRKSNRFFEDNIFSLKTPPQDRSTITSNNTLQDHHQKQENQSGNTNIQTDQMNIPNPLCTDLAHLPTIESADEAISPPSTPGTVYSGHNRQSSTFSGRRSTTAMSGHAETYRSMKGKGNKSKGFSAWDEEESQKKIPSKTLSKWKNLGASNRVEKKRAKNDIVLTPKSILNKSVSSLDLLSNESRNSPVVSPTENKSFSSKSMASGADPLSSVQLRTSETDFFSNSFGNLLNANESTQSFTNSLMKGINPSFEIQTKRMQREQMQRLPQRSASMQEIDQATGDHNWLHGVTPPSPRYPPSNSSIKMISSTARGQAKVTSRDSTMTNSTIQSPSSPTQEIVWDPSRKMRSQTNSTFSTLSNWSNNSKTDSMPSTDNALLQGLQSPIGSLDIVNPSSNQRRVSKNIGVQNIRKTAIKLQEALRESDEAEETERAKERGSNTKVIDSSPCNGQSSQRSSMNASAPSSIFMPPTPTKSNSLPIMLDQLENKNSTSFNSTAHEHDAVDRQKEKTEVIHTPHKEDLEAYNKFLSELQADFGPGDDQDDGDKTITLVKQIPVLRKTRRHRSSTSHKDQLFASERTQIPMPRRSCASLSTDQPITTSSKTSISSHSDPDDVTTNEYEHSQGCSSEAESSNLDGSQQKRNFGDGEMEDSDVTHEEEILQSSVESCISYATIDQTADAQVELLDCRIQSVRRLDITATVPPSPRMIRSDSQQSLLSQAKVMSRDDQEQEEKRNSTPSMMNGDTKKPDKTLCNQVESQSLQCKDCQVQSVNVKRGSTESNVAVTLNWTSIIDSSKLNENRQSSNGFNFQPNVSHIVHGQLELEECEVERIARAWIDSQLGQMQREQALSSSEGLRRASDQLSLGLTEDEICKVNKSVLEQRQREILASAYASTLHNRDQLREKMASERYHRDRNTSTTSSDDSCKQKRRSLHLRPDQIPSPGLFIDAEGASISDSLRTKSLNNSPSRFHPLISPVSATSSARQSFNSIASYKRLSPKKLRE